MCLGVPGQIVEVRERDGLRMATVDFGGTRREVCLAYVPEAGLGDYVVVHVGFAISVVSESEARETQALLEEIAAQELPASSKLAGS
ncbi:MAG TPA: HypC/HybG/HupF family hydrogenase formation chaperone [Anaerolineales bacterium]|nr:HypC/HybG/HupF family hydrogenase formation chaperone [Anaerolineales bacterium]